MRATKGLNQDISWPMQYAQAKLKYLPFSNVPVSFRIVMRPMPESLGFEIPPEVSGLPKAIGPMFPFWMVWVMSPAFLRRETPMGTFLVALSRKSCF